MRREGGVRGRGKGEREEGGSRRGSPTSRGPSALAADDVMADLSFCRLPPLQTPPVLGPAHPAMRAAAGRLPQTGVGLWRPSVGVSVLVSASVWACGLVERYNVERKVRTERVVVVTNVSRLYII